MDPLAALDAAIAAAAPAERAGLIVQLAARLATLGAALVQVGPAEAAGGGDHYITVAELAERMKVSDRYIYRNAVRWPFTRRENRKLLFSAAGVAKHMAQGRR